MTTKIVKGLNALVTGSTSGIGYGIARCLAASGVNVTINGSRDESKTNKLTKGIEELGVQCEYIKADMADAEQVRQMIYKSERIMGKIDILVNNAGIQHIQSVTTYPLETWNKVIAVDLTAPFIATQAVIPIMQKHGFGRIINIASVHGLVGSVHKPAYCAAKHGLVGLTKSVALEVANDGITVNAVCPGYILTPLSQSHIDKFASDHNLPAEQAKLDLVSSKQAMHKFGSPDDIGQMVLHLCTPHSDLITGTCIDISGGWTAQ